MASKHKPPSFQCHICDKKVSRKDNLSAHMANVHSDKKNYYCNICKEHYKNLTSFNEHKKTTEKHRKNLENVKKQKKS